MHRRTVIGALTAIAVLIIGGVFFARAMAAGSETSKPPTPPHFTVAPAKAGQTAPGVTAITPGGAKHSGVILTAGVAPSLTEADVRAYLAHGGMPQAAAGVQPVIMQIRFITAARARSPMAHSMIARTL